MIPNDRLAAESPSLDAERRVIGVELAVSSPMTGEEELEMFSCRHTVRDDVRMPVICFRVTLHTSRGDLTAYVNTRGQVASHRL